MSRYPMPYDLFDSPLQRQWKHDRSRRQRIPLSQTWRGCLGLAALLDHGMSRIHRIGRQMLVSNEDVRWLCLRDVPAHHFPGSKTMNKREVNYANSARAEIRFGIPRLCFNVPSRNSWDFRFLPFGHFLRPYGRSGVELVEAGGDVLNADRFPREFTILNELSSAMTQFAFGGLRLDGRPVRSVWFHKRPADIEPFGIVPPEDWMPMPYLAFPAHLRDELFHSATRAHEQSSYYECPRCRWVVNSKTLAGQAIRVFEDGNFVAACPNCKGFRKWYLADAFYMSTGRSFPLSFRRKFCDAIAEGLPLRATEAMRYLGISHDNKGTGPDVVVHQFASLQDGRPIHLPLPKLARIYVLAEGDPDAAEESHIPAGGLFGRALDELPAESWKRRDWSERWGTLHEVCGGRSLVGMLQKVWFDLQILPHPDFPDQVLVPCPLVASAVREVSPLGLWWDFAPPADHFDAELSAVVLPPLRLARWDGLRHRLPHDVDLDAGIADPRLASSKTHHPTRRRQAATLTQ